MIPVFKIDIDGTDYQAELITQVVVKRRENNYDTCVFHCINTAGGVFNDEVQMFDEVKVYMKQDQADAYTQTFGGYVWQMNPYRTSDGNMMEVKCKGYGAALESTHCSKDYGTESSNPTLDTCKEIWQDLVDNYINKSFADAATGYAVTKTKIADFIPATTISYVNSPFRRCMDVVDYVCDLGTAIAAGAAGPHWMVDNSKNLVINTIGAHEDTTEWPDWFDSTADKDLSAYTFHTFRTEYTTDEYANKVVLVTDMRKPVYDLWTQATAPWGSDGLAAFGTDTGLVGNCLKITQDGVNAGRIFYPDRELLTGDAAAAQKDVAITSATYFSVGDEVTLYDDSPDTETATIASIAGNTLTMVDNLTNAYTVAQNAWCQRNAKWDVTKWGTTRTIPTLSLIYKKNSDWDAGEAASTGNITLYHDATHYWTMTNVPPFSINDPVDEWIAKKWDIGPYAANAQWHWAGGGASDWTDINWIRIGVGTVLGTGDGIGYFDDLHFTGQIARCAYDSGEITSYNERQKVFLSRYSLDDSCVAADDSGTAARIAYAELLRRVALPYSIVFTVDVEPAWMQGQKFKVSGVTFRATEVQHSFAGGRATSQVSATSDLLNSHAVSLGSQSSTNQHALLMENVMVVSKDAKDIRAGSEVDSLLELLSVDYA